MKPKHQVDGSYFLDADPEIFKHVLRFLCHGIYPLAYDSVNGHDLGLYAAISRLADRLQVEKFPVWLKEQRYLRVVQIQISTWIAQEEVDNEAGLVRSRMSNRTNEGNVKFQYFPTFDFVSRYLCPRGIEEHYDNSDACGKTCKKVQGGKEDEYEDNGMLSTLIVKERTLFNLKLCLDE